MKMSILSIATALLFSMTSCNNESSIDGTPRHDIPVTPGTPSGNVATIYTTTSDGTQKLTKSFSEISTADCGGVVGVLE